jgi:hypothetical protein
MTWIIIDALYAAGVIVTATLLRLHTDDNPEWALSETSNTASSDRVVVCVGASLFWPVTLLVVATIKARARWLRRGSRA